MEAMEYFTCPSLEDSFPRPKQFLSRIVHILNSHIIINDENDKRNCIEQFLIIVRGMFHEYDYPPSHERYGGMRRVVLPFIQSGLRYGLISMSFSAGMGWMLDVFCIGSQDSSNFCNRDRAVSSFVCNRCVHEPCCSASSSD